MQHYSDHKTVSTLTIFKTSMVSTKIQSDKNIWYIYTYIDYEKPGIGFKLWKVRWLGK